MNSQGEEEKVNWLKYRDCIFGGLLHKLNDIVWMVEVRCEQVTVSGGQLPHPHKLRGGFLGDTGVVYKGINQYTTKWKNSPYLILIPGGSIQQCHADIHTAAKDFEEQKQI